MGGPCTVRLYAPSEDAGQQAAFRAEAEVRRIEQKYSRYRPDSVLSVINTQAHAGWGVAVDDETAALLDYAQAVWEQSDGVFDVTSGVLRRAWDFKSGHLPDSGLLARTLAATGWDKLRWQRPLLYFGLPDMELDFGGLGKEYAADCAATQCRNSGIQHGLVELGGDIAVVGPHPDGSPWMIGIRHPRQTQSAVASIPLAHGGIASSGDYERYMLVEGRRYCHILHPQTGYPVVSDIAGVTVVGPSCLIAGSATTVAMLKGAAAPAWLDSLALPWLLINAQGERIYAD
ncbi:MAG: FAD:protein FMN transferase [Hahellaceae bacterium]|nr:FAD:protein FMN transferase [Hahellaceae bacterium]MCP5169127.1 FAD:protein FMN transferase [Hahellaceae bacterium]